MGNTEDKDSCGICGPAETAFDYVNTPGAKAARAAGLVNIADLPVGSRGVVEKTSETDHDLEPLVKVGLNPAFVPGLEVTVIAKSPGNGPVIIKAGGVPYDVCHDVASVVWVRKV